MSIHYVSRTEYQLYNGLQYRLHRLIKATVAPRCTNSDLRDNDPRESCESCNPSYRCLSTLVIIQLSIPVIAKIVTIDALLNRKYYI